MGRSSRRVHPGDTQDKISVSMDHGAMLEYDMVHSGALQ